MKVLPYILYALAGAIVLQASIYSFQACQVIEEEPESTSLSSKRLSCAIEIDMSQGRFPGLTVGYNYHLLEECATALGDTLDGIWHSTDGATYLDSLRQGVVDIVVLPFRDSLQVDSVVFTHPIDSTTMWAIRSEMAEGLEELNAWIDALPTTDGYEDDKNCYLNRYSPAKRAEWGRTSSRICPYDALIKKGAAQIGWDWRLLAAVVYHESKFHIEVISPRGAAGLMQMMPRTAVKYGVTNIFDPEQSIEAGVKFIGRLQRMFASQAVNQQELYKFTLAAYNAGEGRILDCINYANSIGADSGTWDGIVDVIPGMRDSITVKDIPEIKLGAFQGYETISYVRQVMSLYQNFKEICPQRDDASTEL